MRKKIIFIVVFLLVAISILTINSYRNPVLKGVVESTIYAQMTEVQGKIRDLNIELGMKVQEGDLIAVIDSTDQIYAIEQTEIALKKRHITLTSIIKGATNEDIEKANSDVAIALANARSSEATLLKAQEDTRQYITLYEIGSISQNELDLAYLREKIAIEAVESANALVQKVREQYALLIRGAEKEAIELAEADILEIESKLKQMKYNLTKHEIRANVSGTIISMNFLLGAIVSPGYNIADISADSPKYIVCYIPKKNSYKIGYDDIFRVFYQKKEYNGEVKYIDVKSQYTPKDMQTPALKNKTSIKIKLLLLENNHLKPGDQVKLSKIHLT